MHSGCFYHVLATRLPETPESLKAVPLHTIRQAAHQSLNYRYQGVDWRKQSNWACNQRLNPTGDFYFDGVTLSPYELVFVKVCSRHQPLYYLLCYQKDR